MTTPLGASTYPVISQPARRTAAKEPALQTGPCALVAAEPQTCLGIRTQKEVQVISSLPIWTLSPVLQSTLKHIRTFRQSSVKF